MMLISVWDYVCYKTASRCPSWWSLTLRWCRCAQNCLVWWLPTQPRRSLIQCCIFSPRGLTWWMVDDFNAEQHLQFLLLFREHLQARTCFKKGSVFNVSSHQCWWWWAINMTFWKFWVLKKLRIQINVVVKVKKYWCFCCNIIDVQCFPK